MKIFIAIIIFITISIASSSQTSIGGKVSDVDSGEELIGANILLEKHGIPITNVATDFNGNYKMMVDPGAYDVKVANIGYPDYQITGVIVKPGQANKLDIQMTSGLKLEEVVVEYKIPLVAQDNTTSCTITSEQIRNLPTRNVTALAATAAGSHPVDDGDIVTVGSCRSGATDYYIDGIRFRAACSMIPSSEIEQLQVITGGLSAEYGTPTENGYFPVSKYFIQDFMPPSIEAYDGFPAY